MAFAREVECWLSIRKASLLSDRRECMELEWIGCYKVCSRRMLWLLSL
jgi:hypothetical protein